MRPALTATAVLAALSCVSFTATAQSTGEAGTFETPVNSAAGTIPWSVAAADFNQDGVSDLAVANLGSGVSVLVGNDDGSFQAPVRYAAGWYPAHVAAGDVNGDGHADLLVGNISDEIDVLAGHGDGTFAAPTVLESGGRPWSIAVGDLDGDGLADIATATGTRSGVTVRLADGAGSFRAQAAYGDATFPTSIAIGDFNEDGAADLAVSSDAGGGVNVMLGSSDGTFQAPLRLSSSMRSSLAVADVNGDGHADIASAGTLASGVGLLLGNGDGTFLPEAVYGPDLIPAALVAADFNADGRADLAVSTYESRGKTGQLYRGHVALLTSTGATLGPAVHYAAGTNPRGLAALDVDRDGAIDLATANTLSADVSVLLNGPVTPLSSMHVARTRPYARVEIDPTKWRVELLVRVEDAANVPLPGTIVTGTWNDGTTGSCVTDAFLGCAVIKPHIPAADTSVTFTITGLSNPTHPQYAYDPSANHDTTGYGDGTTVTVARPW
jgi:hypothetical protein